MSSAAERLARNSLLVREPANRSEFESLVRSGLARLSDAENTALSLDSRFDLAYNAAHALCFAALRYCEFRPSKRYVVFQVLPDTLGLEAAVWRVLDKAHRMRNQSEYEGVMDIEENLVRDVISACKAVANAIQKLPALK